MANEKLTYQIEVEDKATQGFAKVQKSLDGLQDKSDKAAKELERTAKATDNLGKTFIVANLATQAITRGMGFLLSQYRQSVSAANEYQKAMIGLKSTAAAFGESQDAATAAAQRLTSDGMLNMADASKALQNIMNTGLGLDKAEQLIRTYKDQAALGRAANLSFSQAVSNLSESFLTESSAIGNLSGQSENYNQIIERGAAILGKQVASLTEAERAQAKFIGTMELGKVVSGDLARYMETADAQSQIFANRIEALQVKFGQALSPAIQFATQALAEFAIGADGQATPALENIAKTFVWAVGGIKVFANAIMQVGGMVIDFAQQTGDVFSKLFSGDIIGAGQAANLNRTFDSIKQRFGNIITEVDKTRQSIDGINSKIDKEGLGSFANVLKDKAQFAAAEVSKAGKDIADKLKNIGQDMAKELDSYARTSADKIRGFQENLRDLVIRHKDAIRDLRGQIDELNASFAEASKERQDEHTGRKSDIISKYEEETKTLKENLARRLTDTQGSDEQLISFFEAQIAEKERLMGEELRKEDEKFAKEEAKQQASFQKQLTSLQTKLNQELEIERKHQAEFAQFKDAVAEDDITRLKTNFEREMAELKRQHDDRMNELRKQQEEILAVKTATSTAAAKAVQQQAQTRAVTVTTTKSTTPPPGWHAPMAPRFHSGGVVPGVGEVPAILKAGETVMTQQQTQGLMELLKNLGSGLQGGMGNMAGIQMTNHIYDKFDFVGAMREAGWRARL